VSILDLLWFLLPIAAAAGWIAAKRNDARKTRAFWDYTSEFHQGLNVLLSDKQDKPIELFNNATSADRNAAETHIALGNHYRQRGDMERSVFMHQSVLDNEALDEEVRAAARFELARDYDSAGLLDRSEAEFKELIKSEHRMDDAYQSLLQLHERESDWDQAIKVSLDAELKTESQFGRRVAHYYCELASESIKRQENEAANSQWLQALEHDDTCARASMMLAELALEAGQYSQASTLYERVEELSPELMPEIIDRRFEVLRQSGNDAEFDRFLKRIHSQRNAYSVIRSTRTVIAERHNPQLADRFFKDQILKRPSLKGLRDWAHDQVELSKPDEREKVQVICDLLDKVVEDKPAYRCNQCGFQGNVMHWRCPSCEQWDSVSTIIGVEGE
jgi:lipopolysaccharide biosynthesis regulator YciM